MTPDRPRRLGIWCAVSSKAQAADDKVSLDDQERLGREFAASVGADVVAVYTVPGHTRDLIFYHDAEQLMEAYRDLHRDVDDGRLDLLWCLDVDRLGRDPALAAQVLSLVEKNGGEVFIHSAPHVIGQKTAGHRYIAAIQAVRAGEDQARRRQMHRMGMRGRVQRGMIANHPPIGYQPVRDPVGGAVTGYELDDTAPALRLATDLFLRGHTYAEIVRRLEEAPYPAPNGAWQHATVWSILHNDTYAGLPSWGPYQASEPSARFPPLWDPATHAAVLQERQRRRRHSPIRRNAGPLTGVVYCARCGIPMIRNSERYRDRRYHYLVCATHRRRTLTGRSCHHNSIPEHQVLDELVGFLAWLATPSVLDAALEDLRGPGERERLLDELVGLDALLEDLDQQRQRLVNALAAGKLHADLYRGADDRLLEQVARARRQVDQLHAALDALPDLDARRDTLQRLIDDLPRLFSVADPAEISVLLQTAGIHIEIEQNRVTHILLT